MNQKPSPLSRRRFLASTCFASAAAFLVPHTLSAENESPVTVIRHAAATAKIAVHKLRDGVSVLTGSGGNITVLTGPDGTILIDAGITASKPRIVEALTSIDPSPVKHLINTHWHFDHTDGNEWLHSEGARIIAQENTRKHLSTETRVDGWNFTFPPAPAGALPTEVFKQDLTLYLNNAVLALQSYGSVVTMMSGTSR